MWVMVMIQNEDSDQVFHLFVYYFTLHHIRSRKIFILIYIYI